MFAIVRRTSFALAAFAACGPALAAGPDSPGKPEPLRLCADPANLPFSSDDPAWPGLYLEIGDALGAALGRPVTHVWYRTNFGNRAVRVTMLSNQCDATIGLPQDSDFMGPRVIFSKPLFNLGYALAAGPDFDFSGLDSLKGKRVAVQFSTTPQNLLGPRDDVTTVTVLSPDAGMKALAEGRADAAFVWGPTAGYLNASAYGGKFKIIPVDGPALAWPTAIGFAKGNGALRDQVDAALPGLAGKVTELLAKYGFPTTAPVKFGALDREAPASPQTAGDARQGPRDPAISRTRVAAMGEGAFLMAQTSAAVAPASTAPAPGASIDDGKELFNGTCAHCHGPDAIQSEKRIDLRRLTIKYEAEVKKVYDKTVHDGRPSKGMPAWKDVFTDDQLANIYAYLQTVQSKE